MGNNKGKNDKKLYREGEYKYYVNIQTSLRKDQTEKNNVIAEDKSTEIMKQKSGGIKKIKDNKWNIVTILISLVVFFWAIRMDNNTMRNLNMNYVLKTTDIDPLLMKADDAIFNLNPYVYNLDKIGDSGEYANIYFSRINSEGVLIKKIDEGVLSYYDFKLDKQTEKSINDNNIVVPTAKLRKYDIKLFYAKIDQELPISIFHIFLKGYNGAYQFFTIINYVSNIEEYTTEIDGKNMNNELIQLKAKIISDEEVYDNDLLHDVITKIEGSRYSKDTPYKSYKELQSKIIDERNKIKESLK